MMQDRYRDRAAAMSPFNRIGDLAGFRGVDLNENLHRAIGVGDMPR
jgi:hypothetical protein